MKSIAAKLVILVGLVLSLSACLSGGNQSDLNAYIGEVKSRPKGNIEPLPPVRTYDAFIYSATVLRSPFEPPVEDAVVEIEKDVGEVIPPPDETRIKDFLESFNLDLLSMVGTMTKNGVLWALIKDPENGIHKVKTGNFMGRNHGQITKTTPTKIELVETVPNGHGQWQLRPRTITLSEKE